MRQGEISISLNGREQLTTSGEQLAELLTLSRVPLAAIAVAVNGEVVPRSLWSSTQLTDGDKIEFVTIAQGG